MMPDWARTFNLNINLADERDYRFSILQQVLAKVGWTVEYLNNNGGVDGSDSCWIGLTA